MGSLFLFRPNQQQAPLEARPSPAPRSAAHLSNQGACTAIWRLSEAFEEGFRLEIQRGTVAFEHRLFGAPGPCFASRPQGLFIAGHHPWGHPFQPRVVRQDEVNAS